MIAPSFSADESELIMRKTAMSVIVASLVLATTGSFAPVFADGATKSDPKCLCRFQGQRYSVGEYVCIRSKLARCDMFLNNTTWTFLEDSCGSVKLDKLPQSVPASQMASLPVVQ